MDSGNSIQFPNELASSISLPLRLFLSLSIAIQFGFLPIHPHQQTETVCRLTQEAVILLNHANLWNVTRFSKDSTRLESSCSGASCDNLVVIKFSVFQLLFSFSDLWYFFQDRRQHWHQSMRLPTGMQFGFGPNKWLLVGLAATTTATATCQKATATPTAITITTTTATFDNKRQTTRCQVVWQ